VRHRSWLRLSLAAAFVASIITNVFLLGYTIRSQRQAPAGGVLAEGIVAAYPESVRAEFRQVLRENRLLTIAALRDLRQSRRNLAAAAAISPLNEQEVERAMREVRAATDALQTLMQEFLLQSLRAAHHVNNRR
jgi:uncharacterized membrane protein